MSSKSTPWSGSRHGVDLPVARFGLLSSRITDAAGQDPDGQGWGLATTEPSSPGPGSSGAGVPAGKRPGGGAASLGSDPETAGHPYRAGGAGPAYWGGHALLGLVLGIAVLLVAGGFCLGRVSDTHTAGKPGVTTFVAATSQADATEPQPAAPAPAEPARPESPEVGAGFVFGKVRANDDGVLTVRSELNRSEVIVYSDSSTKLYVLIASDPAGIDIGAPVWIWGRQHADGSLTARTIAGISMHGNTK